MADTSSDVEKVIVNLDTLYPADIDFLLSAMIVRLTQASVDQRLPELERYKALYYVSKFANIRQDCGENHISYLRSFAPEETKA